MTTDAEKQFANDVSIELALRLAQEASNAGMPTNAMLHAAELLACRIISALSTEADRPENTRRFAKNVENLMASVKKSSSH